MVNVVRQQMKTGDIAALDLAQLVPAQQADTAAFLSPALPMKHARRCASPPRQLLDRAGAELRRQWLESVAATWAGEPRLTSDPRLEAALVDVELARSRLRAGRYGVCVQCDDTIDAERLIVHPSALRCWSCQQRCEGTGG